MSISKQPDDQVLEWMMVTTCLFLVTTGENNVGK